MKQFVMVLLEYDVTQFMKVSYKKPTKTKKMFRNFGCFFDIPLSHKTQKKIRFRFFLILSSFRIQIEDKNFHLFFWREISKFLSSDFNFDILFEHQFNNLIEFSEISFVKWIFFFGNLWKHENHCWNDVSRKKN